MSDPDMVTTGEDIEVFVSHSTAEREIADNIVSRLEAAGHGCWLAHRDASPGDDWAASIVSAIADSRLVVLIYSASANRSQQVLREMERAVSSNRPIIPLIIEEAPMSKAMEYFLGAAHWINVSGAEQEKAVTAAVATIERLLGRTDNLLPAPIRPVMSLTLQAMYGAVTLAGVVFAVSIYRFFFNSLSETALVAMSALWVPTIVFGVYGLVWGREAVIKSLIAAAISGAALVVFITLVWPLL
jgi:hypothetical protein